MKPKLICRFLFLLLLSFAVQAQTLVEGETLKRILQGLHAHDIYPAGTGALPLGSVCPGKQVIVESADSVIRDIRLSLFYQNIEPEALKPVYHFIERYWLDLLLQNRTDRLNSLRGDFVIIQVNKQNLAIAGYTVEELLQQITPSTSFKLESDTAAFKATWHFAGTIGTIEMVFKKQYDLILGKDKKELSHLLVGELKSYNHETEKQKLNIQETASFQLTSMQGLFFDPAGSFLIPQMKSGRYILQAGQQYEYLFRERFRDESLLNLFSNADEMGWEGSIEVHLKGYKLSEKITLRMNDLVAFMKDQNCKTYVGMEEDTKDTWTGTAIYVNSHLMYKHLLYFTFPREAFKRPETKIKAVLYPYIPLNNLTDLYNERNEPDNK